MITDQIRDQVGTTSHASTGMCGTASHHYSHPDQHPINTSHGSSTRATASANIALIIPDDEHAFPLIPDYFPSLFLYIDTYVCIYSDYKTSIFAFSPIFKHAINILP
jgi:hypothetical protein